MLLAVFIFVFSAQANANMLWSWGSNQYGELGNGSTDTSPQSSPAQAGDFADIVDLQGGLGFGVALDSAGNVWTWGNNEYGQLGLGYSDSSMHPAPEMVPGLPMITAISVNRDHTLALDTGGMVWVWGQNYAGQMGDGSIDQSPHPVPMQVPGLSGIVKIAAGVEHSMSVDGGGHAWAWGNNEYGQLGLGYADYAVHAPEPVSVLQDIQDLALGYGHTVATDFAGNVWTWGNNSSGQLGIGTQDGDPHPIPTSVFSGALSIAAGPFDSVVINRLFGTLWIWGDNYNGQVGNGTNVNVLSPFNVLLPAGVVDVSMKPFHTTALLSDGTVWTWGDNTYGQLGRVGDPLVPMVVNGLPPVREIDSGGFFSMALEGAYVPPPVQEGVYTWGNNSQGQLGDNTLGGRTEPEPIGLTGVVALACAMDNSMALTADGTVFQWGTNNQSIPGEFVTPCSGGPVTYSNTPQEVFLGASAIHAGWFHSLAIDMAGTLFAWGNNQAGQLGQGMCGDYSLAPLPVPLPGMVVDAAGGTTFTVALLDDGTVWTWGDNSLGQLGTGDFIERLSPVQVFLPRIVDVDAGTGHVIALDESGAVWTWGDNSMGQLGVGSTSNSSLPVMVQGLPSGAAAVVGGGWHSAALMSDGTVWTWGQNDFGQLGYGSPYGTSSVPVQVVDPSDPSGYLTGVASVVAKCKRTAALKMDGTVWTWGGGPYTGPLSSIPVQVSGLSGVTALAAGMDHTLAVVGGGGTFNQPPVANAGMSRTVECTGAGSASLTLDGSASYDPDGDALTYAWSWPSGSASGVTPPVTLGLGTHIITLTVDDGKGGVSSSSVSITVADTTPPSLDVGGDVTIEATGPDGAPYAIPVNASDNCCGVGVSTTGELPTYPLGSTTVGVTATDCSGNAATASVTITVVDTTAPNIVSPADVTVYASGPLTTVDIGTAAATDAVGVASIVNDAPSSYPVGTTVVTWTASDAAGNTATATQKVNVLYTFGGFESPLGNGKPFKLGRPIPVKFQLTYADGTNCTDATCTIMAQQYVNSVPVGEPMDPGGADYGNLFRYDPVGGMYVYNLHTDLLGAGDWQLIVTLDDGTVQTAMITLQ